MESSNFKNRAPNNFIPVLPSIFDLQSVLNGKANISEVLNKNIGHIRINLSFEEAIIPRSNISIFDKPKVLFSPDSNTFTNSTARDSLFMTPLQPSYEWKYEDLQDKVDKLGEVKKASINQTFKPNETESKSDFKEEEKSKPVKRIRKSNNFNKRKLISFPNARENEDKDFLSTRCDVVYKTILRDFRRYYQEQFKSKSNLNYRNKSKQYKECLENYANEIIVENNLSTNDLEELIFHMGWLIAPNDMVKFRICQRINSESLNKETKIIASERQVKQVHDWLYKFSIQKSMDLMKNNYYFSLFRIYYTKIQNGEIEMSETIRRNIDAYTNAFDMLLSVNDSN